MEIHACQAMFRAQPVQRPTVQEQIVHEIEFFVGERQNGPLRFDVQWIKSLR